MTGETATSKTRGRMTSRIGVVTKDKMDKSVVVKVERVVKHDRYKRYIRRSSRCMAHDEKNECRVGDTVEIVESHPLSLRKRWRVRRIVRAAVGVVREPAAKAAE